MSQLGVHVASSRRDRFGALLDLAQTGSPLACVVLLDQNAIAEIRARSPQTIVAYRTQRSPINEDNPPSFMDVPLEQQPALAEQWMQSLFPLWSRVRGSLVVKAQAAFAVRSLRPLVMAVDADYWIPNNEQDIGTIDHAQKLNAFFLRCMQLADAQPQPFKLGICSFSTGNPSDDGGLTLEQRWTPMLPAITYACEHHHAIVLHVHALGTNMQAEPRAMAFRHERTLEFFATHRLRPKVIIGEWSNGVGGIEPSLATYMSAVKWWDLAAMASQWRGQMLGAALYGFNAAETLTPAVPQIIEWIATHPTPPIVEPPPEQHVLEVTPINVSVSVEVDATLARNQVQIRRANNVIVRIVT